MSAIVGIDVGVHGALAVLSPSGELLAIHDMPSVEVKVGRTKRTRVVPASVAQMVRDIEPAEVFIERLHGMPKMGGATMFQLGYAAGIIEGVLATLAIPVTFVSPQAWKRGMRVGKDKGVCRQRAMQLWPSSAALFTRVKDDGRAEACLIARYGLMLRAQPARSAAA